MTSTTKVMQRCALLLPLCLVIAALFLIPRAGQAEITASATLNTASFSIDQTAQLTVTVNGAKNSEIEIPDVTGLTFYRRGQRSQINIINGRYSSSISTTYLIQAHESGEYTVPPIRIVAGKTTLTTEPIPFEVLDPTASGPAHGGTAVSGNSTPDPTATGEDAFLRLLGLKQQSFIGEILPIEIKAYFRRGLRANLNSYPSLQGNGCVMPQLNEEPRQSQETINGVSYSVLTWKTALSTIKEGAHAIRLELDATLLLPQRSMSSSLFGRQSPFDDDFLDSFFGGYQKRPLRLASPEIDLEILPLPETGKPANFTGAIGAFNLHISATPEEVEIGEPLTLTMTVTGKGNFNRVEAPLFPHSSDWKTYSPSATFRADDETNHSGSKTFEQALVARTDRIQAIPSLSFSYFDPARRQYVTLTSEPVALAIRGKAAAVPRPAPASQPPPSATPKPPSSLISFTGLAPLQLEPGKPITAIKPLFQHVWFGAIIVACLVVLCLLAGLWIARRRAKNDVQGQKKQRLHRALELSLAAVTAARKTNDSQAFLAHCRAAIQQQLGILWQLEPATITRADLTQRLHPSSGLHEIFTLAEQAAYAGIKLSDEKMEEYFQTMKKELEELI